MRRYGFICGLFMLSILVLGARAADKNCEEPNTRLDGFSEQASRAERDWEVKFRATPDPAHLSNDVHYLSAHPHNVGSAFDKENAEWILSKFKEWGWDAHIETFNVLFPTPRERLVELVRPTKYVAKLKEPPVPEDPSTSDPDPKLPGYNAYSADGDVTAPLVYANYGRPEDYVALDRRGISVRGAIVIVRIGKSWRGIKPKVAAEHGAVGCLIYSEPKDDGYFHGAVFPKGPWRPPFGVQRGSVMDMTLYPGDPLTPEIGSAPDAKRLPIKDAPTITKIPTLPLSYGDAEPLLAALRGSMPPHSWRGVLPIAYHTGPGPAVVHMRVKSNWDIVPINDVIARIPGTLSPDEWVLRGNHFDAWVFGAKDPDSAMADELEEARAFGELLKQGWKPKRTIVYCAWDGEEPGLLGSTEWVETHAHDLAHRAVAYINTDSNGRGYFKAWGSHSLEKLINGVERDITDPEKHISIWERNKLWQIRTGNAQRRLEVRKRPDLRIQGLGSGSDFTAFVDHLGIASLNLAFKGEDWGGEYHSTYDDWYWYTHFCDANFEYGRALAQTVGTAVMRLADAQLIPYDYTDLAYTIRQYSEQLKNRLAKERAATKEQDKEINEGVYAETSNPKKPYVPPSYEPIPPHLDFAPLDNAADDLSRAAEKYKKVVEQAEANGGDALARPAVLAVNHTLIMSERRLTNPEGLPGRPWYKHEIYAPGAYTGYYVKTIPAVREAIEQRKWDQADEALVEVGQILDGEADLINTAAAQLQEAIK